MTLVFYMSIAEVMIAIGKIVIVIDLVNYVSFLLYHLFCQLLRYVACRNALARLVSAVKL